MRFRFAMADRYKSLAAMKPDAWITHFRSTVGKTETWKDPSKLVIIKRNRNQQSSSSALPLNSISPVEQYTNMAQAEMEQNKARQKNESFPSDTSRGSHRRRRRHRRSRRRKRKREGKDSSHKNTRKTKKSKKSKD